MMMRVFLSLSLLAACAVSPARAYENFIPLGTGYSTEVGELTEFTNEDGEIAARADEYETEIYRQGRDEIETDSRIRQFFSDAESTGSDLQIDY